MKIIQMMVALLLASSTVLLSLAGGFGFHSARFDKPPCRTMVAYSPPVAVASANPTTIIVGNKVTFDASASTDEYFIALYRWCYTVGNETRLFSGMYASELFNRTGTFVVWLTVQNGWGMSDTDSVTITVLPATGPNSPPVAQAGTDIRIAVDTAVMFDGSMSWDDIGIIDYLWTFDDGGTQVRLWGCSPYYLFATS